MITKAQIKQITSYKENKYRRNDNVFVVEGNKMVEELIKSNKENIVNIFALKSWTEENTNMIESIKEKVFDIDERELKKISSLTTPNNVLAISHCKKEEAVVFDNNLILMLDSINNPGNLGTIIRVAAWFGIKDIVCSNDTVDCYNSKVLQATMGSIFHINIVYTDLNAFLLQVPKSYDVYGTVLKEGKDIYKEDLSKEGIIVIGNESHGISEKIKQFINRPLTIPTFSKNKDVESLNASIATAIVISEFKRR